MKIIHGLWSRFLAEAACSTCTKTLSLSLRNCRLKVLFSLRTTQESAWDTEIYFFPKEGRYTEHAKHLNIMLCHSLSSDYENSVTQEIVDTTLLFHKILSMSKINFTFIILGHFFYHFGPVWEDWNYSRCFHVTILW